MSHRAACFLLLISLFAETLSYTYLQDLNLYYTLSVFYFLGGLGICIVPLLSRVSEPTNARKNFIAAGILSFALLVLLTLFLPAQLERVPIDYHLADMLPRIKIYADRFLHGRYVYDDVKEIWSGNLPPYFPAVWFPYIPSVIVGYDMRWTTIVLFWSCIFLMLRLIKKSYSWVYLFETVGCLSSLFFLINFHFWREGCFWTMTYEGLIAAYYIILCLTIIRRNPYLIGAGISLCMLSRFSLLFWIPSFVLFLWFRESKLFAVKTVLTAGFLTTFLFLVPFVAGHINTFTKMLSQYQVGTENFWRINQIDSHNYKEVGLFKFFTSGQINLLRRIQLITSILAPVFLILFATKFLKSAENKNVLIGLCSLKFSLLFFYNFIEMPFHYLFITPTVISYVICIYFFSLTIVPSGRFLHIPNAPLTS